MASLWRQVPDLAGLAGWGAPVLAAFVLAGCLVAVLARAAVLMTRGASFAARGAALQSCVVVLLVFSVVEPLARGGAARWLRAVPTSVAAAPRSGTPSAARVGRAPRIVMSALEARRQNPAARQVTGVAVLVWLLGAGYALLRLARGARQVDGIRRRVRPCANVPPSIPLGVSGRGDRASRPVPIGVSDEIDIPYVSGSRSPMIVLPGASESWSLTEWQAVLRHEIAHIVRGDVAMQWVRQCVLALHWFNPAVRWLVRRTDEICEGACDDAVLLQGGSTESYVETLLSFAGATWAYPAAPAPTIRGRSGLERRVSAMADERRPRRAPERTDRLTPRVIGVGGGLLLAILAPGPATAVVRTPIAALTTATNAKNAQPREPRHARVSGVARTSQRSATDDRAEALQGLGAALADVNPIVRDAAARALAAWRPAEVVERLTPIARSADDERRGNARAALTAIGVSP